MDSHRVEDLARFGDRDAFLHLDRRLEAVRPALQLGDAPARGVDELHPSIAHDVVDVLAQQEVRVQRDVDLNQRRTDVFGRVDVVDVELVLDRPGSVLGEENVAPFGVGLVVAARTQPPHSRENLSGGSLGGGRTGEHERNEGLVDEHRVGLVDDDDVGDRAQQIVRMGDHLLAQDVEADLGYGTVCDVARVRGLALLACRGLGDISDGQPESLEQRAHPLGVAARKVVVDRHQVHVVPLKRVAGSGDGAGKSLAFASGHLHDIAREHAQRALQLDVEWAQADRALRSLPGQGQELGGIRSGIAVEVERVRGVGELARVQPSSPRVEFRGGVDGPLGLLRVSLLRGAEKLPEAASQSHVK